MRGASQDGGWNLDTLQRDLDYNRHALLCFGMRVIHMIGRTLNLEGSLTGHFNTGFIFLGLEANAEIVS